MVIQKNLTTQNFNAGTASRIKYIVIHYTANNGDTALGNTNYFKSYRGASAHYFVDEKSIYQSIEDKNIAWHCGANSYRHRDCRNYNSLGVELCSIKVNGKYAFKPETVKNAVELVKTLMAKYKVPIDRVIRHYDVTGKRCPEPFVADEKAWQNFKSQLTNTKPTEAEDDEVVTESNITVNGKDIKINRILKNDKNYIDLRGLENAGFKVSYNAKTKLPTLTNDTKKVAVDINGSKSDVDAVNIEGANYVPVRAICEALGKDVDFKDGVITITDKAAKQTKAKK